MSKPIVTVTTGPTDKSVATLAAVAGELGITVAADPAVDAKINRLIAATSALFESDLGRAPWRQVYSEKLPGDGGIYLPLSAWPIESVSSILDDTVAVTATDYSVAETERSKVYREDGWGHTKPNNGSSLSGAGKKKLRYTAAYTAGWIMPGKWKSDWAAATAYAVGDFVRSTDLTVTVLFECTTAGTSDATEPTWDTDEGDETTDNDITWTARKAEEMPFDLQEAAIAQVVDWFVLPGQGSAVGGAPAGVKRERDGPTEIEYFEGGAGSALSGAVSAIVRRYR